MAEKSSMVFYYEWIDLLDMIPDKAQAYDVIHAIIDYLKDGEVKEFSETGAKMAYRMMKNQAVRDTKKYEEIKAKRAEAGKLGGRPHRQDTSKKTNGSYDKANKTNAFSEKQTKAKKPVNVYGNDNATVNGNATDNVNADGNCNDNENSNGTNTEYITAGTADATRSSAKGIDALTAEQPLINYFYEQYKAHTGKDHPSVSVPKLVEISTVLNSNDADESFVDGYFGDETHRGICGDSDCSIFHFANPTVQELLTDRVLK